MNVWTSKSGANTQSLENANLKAYYPLLYYPFIFYKWQILHPFFGSKTSQMPRVSAEYWPWIRHASGGWSRILWLNWCPFEDADPRIGKAFHGFDIPFHMFPQPEQCRDSEIPGSNKSQFPKCMLRTTTCVLHVSCYFYNLKMQWTHSAHWQGTPALRRAGSPDNGLTSKSLQVNQPLKRLD